MTQKRRIRALECEHKKRQQAAAPDLVSIRRFYAALHHVYGPADQPAPELLDAELLELDARFLQSFDN